MSTRNRALLEKADIAVSDLITDGGYLQPENSRQFMRILIDEARLMKMVTFTPMKSPQRIIDETRFEGSVGDSQPLGTLWTDAPEDRTILRDALADAPARVGRFTLPDEKLSPMADALEAARELSARCLRAGAPGEAVDVWSGFALRHGFSPVPEPEIPFAWPLSVECANGRAYVADLVNRRVVAVKFGGAAMDTEELNFELRAQQGRLLKP